MMKYDAIHLRELFTGKEALFFWGVQIFGLVLPVILLLIRQMRKPLPLLIISTFVLIVAWLKRYIIVVPPQGHPYLPVQYVPAEWHIYKPTLIETLITLTSFVLVLIIITVLAKFFPVVPICELSTEADIIENQKDANNSYRI
jgi:molybdopterin-containing oxidoreductase family membrane subunit